MLWILQSQGPIPPYCHVTVTSTVSEVNNTPCLAVLLQGLGEGMHARHPAQGLVHKKHSKLVSIVTVRRLSRFGQLDTDRAKT